MGALIFFTQQPLDTTCNCRPQLKKNIEDCKQTPLETNADNSNEVWKIIRTRQWQNICEVQMAEFLTHRFKSANSLQNRQYATTHIIWVIKN